MPRLLLLCEYPTLCGGEQSMLSTLSAVADAGFEIQVAAPPEGPLIEALQQRNVPTVTLRMMDSSGQRKPLEELRDEIGKLLHVCKPDLVHSNSLSMGRIVGPVVSEQGIPSVAHLRDIIKLSRAVIRDLNCNDRLLAVSAATRVFHIEQGLSNEKTVILHNGVDLRRFW